MDCKAVLATILSCCCCGARTLGRQWHNRDTGYGICPKCVKWIAVKWPNEDLRSLYGVEGVHYNVTPDGSSR